MSKKRLLNALFKTILFFALFHLTLLAILFIMSGNIVYINLFSIIGLSSFFPGIEKGGVSFMISVVVCIIVYLIFLITKGKKKA